MSGAVAVPADPVIADIRNNAEAELVAKSTALLASVGFAFVPITHAIGGTWDLMAISPRGITLIAARASRPDFLGSAYSAPPGWPPVVRLVLVWNGTDPLPTSISLG
jgi:hypothetical protein